MTGKPFALWVTGLPASGKSTITAALVGNLNRRNVFPVVLESDRMRKILTPEPTYGKEERDLFYRQLVALGETIFRSGVPVIFDATANRRIYRDNARTALGSLVEIYVNSPLNVCRARDPKGIYAAAAAGTAAAVPGVQSTYEPPERPDLVVDGMEPPERNAEQILGLLKTLGYV